MKVEEVPQDRGMAGDQKEVCYAVDEQGRYVLAPSLGWEAKSAANAQAWEMIAQQVEDALAGIRRGKASPLAYHMVRHQMNAGLLAKYMGLFRWQVRRHLKPGGYRRMTLKTRQRYADLFEMPLEELDRVPAGTGIHPAEDMH